ncbi:hypothetical protein MF271_05050 [Deinococcus sp. KNUC1210]|uniref:hypothetical protein n=1 Tax=Deinococcus sp. KNUC1210 TaxID=2917691 RepID=UPI001EF0FD93|nr:hypothetical protein [Deinococcus sp. KNUC1210]ULH16003.1 hypothetical protein MF271_05050 [Deinococcus sp. KNUC1210]
MTVPRKKPVNGRNEGASAERELANLLTSLGFEASRGQQQKGGADSPDVICEALSGFHIEAKFSKACKMHSPATLAEWDAQAIRDAAGLRVPLVVHRWNGQRVWWVRVLLPARRPVWLTLTDFLNDVDHWRVRP